MVIPSIAFTHFFVSRVGEKYFLDSVYIPCMKGISEILKCIANHDRYHTHSRKDRKDLIPILLPKQYVTQLKVEGHDQ
jgi:hypothetical protein